MNLKKLFNFIFPFQDFFYILQLEEYETKRYIKTAKRLFFKRNLEKRGKLVYTKRVRLTLVLSIFIFLFFSTPLTPIISALLIPVWVGLANAILDPYFANIKRNIHRKARKFFADVGRNTIVISVAGSHGKTTTKNFIYQLVKDSYKTQMIPGNINTPTGNGVWLMNNFKKNTEVLIIETDAYFVGEIMQCLEITPPDISILTNIGDQHLERLGSQKKLAEALSHALLYTKEDAKLITSEEVIKTLKKYELIGKNDIADKKVISKPFDNLVYAKEVAKILNIDRDIIKATLKELEVPDRRGNITKMGDFDVIDNSYNISEITAKYGIENAKEKAKKLNKKLVVITAGIPELGEENKDGNKNLGAYLDKHADEIVLLKSILYTEVLEGIKEKEVKIENNFQTALENVMSSHDPKKTLILLQPELNDLYY